MVSQSAALSAPRMSLSTIAYEALIEAILEHRVAAGEHLSIDALAREFGMSITPVREALARTAAEGLTHLDDNRGYSVAAPLTVREFHDLFAARRAIETAALQGPEPGQPGLWVAQVREEDVGRFRNLVEGMEALGRGTSYAGYSRFSLLDRSLHQRLVQLAGNRFLASAWECLHFHLHMSRLYSGAGIVDHQEAHVEHLRIVDALERRDGRDVVSASEEHATRAEERLEPLLAAALLAEEPASFGAPKGSSS